MNYIIICPFCNTKQFYRRSVNAHKNSNRYHAYCKNFKCNRHFDFDKPLQMIEKLNLVERHILSIYYHEFDKSFTQIELQLKLNVHKSSISRAISHLLDLDLIKPVEVIDDFQTMNKNKNIKYVRNFNEKWDYYCNQIQSNISGQNVLVM